MTMHNQEGRGGAPDKRQILNSVGVGQFNAAYQRNHLAEQVYDISFGQMYPELVRQLAAAQNAQYQSVRATADRTSTGALGNMAGRGAVVQTPGQWSPRQEVRADAPQGPFGPNEYAAELQPQPGFEDMYRPVDPHSAAAEAQDAGSRYEDYLLQQDQTGLLENPN